MRTMIKAMQTPEWKALPPEEQQRRLRAALQAAATHLTQLAARLTEADVQRTDAGLTEANVRSALKRLGL